jgi:ornithine carbamoyltransferase
MTTPLGSQNTRRSEKTDVVTLADWDRPRLEAVLDEASRLKQEIRAQGPSDRLRGRILAMIFHKPSLRTRVSFEVGMTQLGGAAVYITEREIGIDSREAVEDVARVLSGYVDAIMIRTFSHDLVRSLAAHATIPVINGLDDRVHPCQILADLMTLRELGFEFEGLPVAWLGDGNNVVRSWIAAAAHFGLDLRLAVPPGHDLHRRLGIDGAGGRGGDPQEGLPSLPDQRRASSRRRTEGDRAALPARASWRGDHG